MNIYKIIYTNGKTITIEAKNTLEVVKRFDLANKNNIDTKVIQLNSKGGE